MLLEIALADAYGAGFEFCEPDLLARDNTVQAFSAHGLGNQPGCYTDDTQMSIAVAEVLLAEPLHDTANTSATTFADAFVHAYKRDRRVGYARGFAALLDQVENGAQLQAQIRPDSRRNGAAMRAVPLGLLPDTSLMLAACQTQARITHDTAEGVLAAQVVSLITHLFLYHEARLADLPSLIQSALGLALRADWQGAVACDALETVHAAHSALQARRSMRDLLQACVAFGGDVDSVAAIALGWASVCHEYQADLPAVLYAGLENGTYGKAYLQNLDAQLAQRFPVLQKFLR